MAQLPRALSPDRRPTRPTAVTLYEEKDDIAFSVGVDRTTDDSLIIVSTGNNSSTEVRFVPADDPTRPLTLVRPRARRPAI